MQNIERVNEFLSTAGIYFLATVDDANARVRPIGLNLLIEGKIYFGVGTFKDVYKQMEKCPNVEICAFSQNKTLRYSGKAVFTTDETIAEKAIEAMPVLKNIYNETTGNKMGMFYLENATAKIYNGITVEETISL